MATDVQIASLALTRIGHSPITSFSSVGDKAQRWMNSNYEFIRAAMIREHPWKFAIKRGVLTRDTVNAITGATKANPVVITSAAHGRSNGDVVFINGVVGMTEINNLTFTVANQATNTFELSGINGTAYTSYSSGGSVYGYIPNEFAYRFALPSDCLRLLRINGDDADMYRVEAGYVYTDEGTVSVEYIFDQGTESAFDAQFVDLLASRLSAECAFHMTGNTALTEQCWTIYNNKLSMARSMDSMQGKPRPIEADAWLNARA